MYILTAVPSCWWCLAHGVMTGQERVSIDSDSEEEAIDDGLTGIGDPWGDQDGSDINIDAPSPPKKVDHQEAQVPPNDPAQLNEQIPPCHSAQSNKGIPAI